MKWFGYLLLPLLFWVYNAAEVYLKLNHSSLCESTGCKLADGLLRFDSIYLNWVGTLGAFFLFVLGWLTYREKIDKKLFFIALTVAILFETIMLSYQFYASPQMCKFCMGVYGFLIVIALFTMRKYFIALVPAILALITAMSFLRIPDIAPAVTADGRYLIQSPTCPHCKKVKHYFKEHDITFQKISIDSAKAQQFITFLGYHTIPMLIIKKGQYIEALNGDEAIINYFEHQLNSKNEESSKETESAVSAASQEAIDVDSLYGKIGGDEGCGFLPTEKEESCDTPEENGSK